MEKHGLKPEDLEPDEDKDPEYIPKKVGHSKGGAPMKKFEDLSRNRQIKRLKPCIENTAAHAKKNKIDVIKVCAFMAEVEANTRGDEEQARMFKAIQNDENPLQHKRMSTEKAVSIQVLGFKYLKRISSFFDFSVAQTFHNVEITEFFYNSDFS